MDFQEKEKELLKLKARVAELEEELRGDPTPVKTEVPKNLPFPLQDYQRYGRQMILDGFGLPAQIKLSQSSVLVVGAGGLGCPALQYLAAAGVGTIGIIDHDVVELSNLQRQILHTDARLGWSKAQSARQAIEEINPSVKVIVHDSLLIPSNAIKLLTPYTVILDCTDNAPTRYLLSDASVKLGKPLVSGAALRYDGQLCTYNLGEDWPCFRCLFPVPPSEENTGTCEETGVLGVVTGIIGTLQAMEAIKIISGLNDPRPSLLIFSALSTSPFRTMKIRSKRPSCPGCGPESKLRKIEDEDYVAFCGGTRSNLEESGLVCGEVRISTKDLSTLMSQREHSSYRIVDVRPAVEYGICHLPATTNIPLSTFMRNPKNCIEPSSEETIFICRRGNDSQIAASAWRTIAPGTVVKDVIGGLVSWTKEVDSNFPRY